jgi:hypothetical protein
MSFLGQKANAFLWIVHFASAVSSDITSTFDLLSFVADVPYFSRVSVS